MIRCIRQSSAVIALFMSFAFAQYALADSPLRPPESEYFQSPSLTCAAKSDPEINHIEVFKPGRNNFSVNYTPTDTWIVPQWSRQVFVADNCKFIIVSYYGLNLLNIDDKKSETTIFTLFSSNGAMKTVPLSQLYKNLDVLPKTSSHWLLHNGIGWNGTDIMFHTTDGRQVKLSESDFKQSKIKKDIQ